MKSKQPSDPSKRKLVGFFQAPPADASPEVERAWVNSIVDEMLRIEKQDAAQRKQAKRPSKKRRQMP